jgi:hypothetical protein
MAEVINKGRKKSDGSRKKEKIGTLLAVAVI